MPITDVEAVSFSNEKARVVADKMAQLYNFAKQIVDEWNANSLSVKLTNDAEPIFDNSDVDGRHPIVGSDVNNIMNRCIEIIADYEAGSNAKLNTILRVSVRNS